MLECAEKLHYSPNPIALSLKEKRSRSIAVLVCEIANSFFSQVINGIESIAYNKGYNVIISQSQECFEREANDLQYLASRSIAVPSCATVNDVGQGGPVCALIIENDKKIAIPIKNFFKKQSI